MAHRLTTAETSDTLPKLPMSTGTRPSVTASCTRRYPRNAAGRLRYPDVAYRIAATAPNDSQNPGASSASGSSNTTAPAQAASPSASPMRRRMRNAAVASTIMIIVRWVGTDQPASAL